MAKVVKEVGKAAKMPLLAGSGKIDQGWNSDWTGCWKQHTRPQQ